MACSPYQSDPDALAAIAHTYPSREAVLAAGYADPSDPRPAVPAFGQLAVVRARSALHRGRVVGVTRSYVLVALTTPTVPGLVTWVRIDRRTDPVSGRSDGFVALQSAFLGARSPTCPVVHPRFDRPCVLSPGHPEYHRTANGLLFIL
jgi:hypothetical protein